MEQKNKVIYRKAWWFTGKSKPRNRLIHTSTKCHGPDQYIHSYSVLKHISTHNIFKF